MVSEAIFLASAPWRVSRIKKMNFVTITPLFIGYNKNNEPSNYNHKPISRIRLPSVIFAASASV